MAFYDDMADMVQDMLLPDAEGGLGQGVVKLRRVTTVPGAEPWDPPTETVTEWVLKAAVERKSQAFERGTLIQETGSIVIFAPIDGVEPALTDTIIVDGVERAVTDLKRIPEAGTVSAWKAWCAA